MLAFTARRGVYGSWRVDPGSIEITAQPRADGSSATRADVQADGSAAASADASANGSPAASRPFRDPLTFLTRARDLLGLDGTTLGHLIRELTLTLSADARLDHTALTADRLAAQDYAELEGHQTGHPWLVASKGRLGFSAADAARFTPETRSPLRLPWIAVSTRIAQFRGVGRVSTPDQLYAGELDPDVRDAFADVLRARGHDPEDYFYLPVHPWQWDEWIVPLFAPAIADGDIVALHTDGDARLPQQSIRTFANVDRPERHTVKLPLSILNTLVWRGLPTERTLAAPAVTSWVQGLCEGDPFLRDTCRVVLLGEVASVAVEHPLYDHLPEAPYQYKELLGAIWREPLPPRLAPGERARTLASLLHTDPTGRAFTAELVERSGLAPETWLKRLFAALLPPLLHFLYRYGTVFSPARRERHRRVRRERRARTARHQGLRRRRQRQRPPAAGTRHHARRGARRPPHRGTVLPHPVHPLRPLRRRLPLSVPALRGAAQGSPRTPSGHSSGRRSCAITPASRS